MAFVLTYSTLVTKLQSYLERADPAVLDSIDMFILLAERQTSKDLKMLGSEVYVTGSLTIGSNVLIKPSRWLNTITFNIGNGTGFNTRNQLYQRSYEFLRAYWPDDTQQGFPKYYSDYGYLNWLIVPTPDVAYPFEISYLEMFQPIDITNQTNWLTEFAPEALFYAAMIEASTFLKNDDGMLPMWQQRYAEATGKLTTEDKARFTDRTSDRNKD